MHVSNVYMRILALVLSPSPCGGAACASVAASEDEVTALRADWLMLLDMHSINVPVYLFCSVLLQGGRPAEPG